MWLVVLNSLGLWVVSNVLFVVMMLVFVLIVCRMFDCVGLMLLISLIMMFVFSRSDLVFVVNSFLGRLMLCGVFMLCMVILVSLSLVFVWFVSLLLWCSRSVVICELIVFVFSSVM